MKKIILMVLLLTFVMFVSINTYAALLGKDTTKTKAEKEAQKKMTAEEKAKKEAAEKEAKEIKQKKDAANEGARQLDAHEWPIYLTPMVAGKGTAKVDYLTFIGKTAQSKNLYDKGYLPSNCAISLKSDGTVVWETMQEDDKSDRASWLGELKGTFMKGVLSLQSAQGATEDYNFNTNVPAELLTAPKPKEEKVEKKAAETKKEEPAKPKAKEDKTKKKKGW